MTGYNFRSLPQALITIIVLGCNSLATTALAAPTPKIIGGDPVASASEYPWQVALFADLSSVYLTQFCGGTLLSDRWVLTAAHCRESSSRAYVLVGTIDLDHPGSGEIAKVQTWFVHPDFNPNTYNNDIALVKLETPLDLEQCGDNCLPIQPVTLDKEPFVMPLSTPAWISGWGNRSTTTNDFSPILEAAEVNIVDCLAGTQYPASLITNKMFCAGVGDYSVDTCQGDSGGPIVVEDNDGLGTMLLAGITSWGEGCAVPNYPGVYTRVAMFKDWIDQTMLTNCCTASAVLKDTISRSSDEKSKLLGSLEWWVLMGLGSIGLIRNRRSKN